MTSNHFELLQFCNDILKPETYQKYDYAPNGLQIEGKKHIRKIAFAVSATAQTIEKTIECNADALFVHHGLFWKGTNPFSEGLNFRQSFYKYRLNPLIKNDIHLFAYHLPLDGHQEYGNAVQLGISLQKEINDTVQIKPFFTSVDVPYGVILSFQNLMTKEHLNNALAKVLQGPVYANSPYANQANTKDNEIKNLAIITGGASKDWSYAIEQNLTAYLTGEIRENHWAEASEQGIFLFVGGHYRTEVFGVSAIEQLVKKNFPKIETFFIKENSPI